MSVAEKIKSQLTATADVVDKYEKLFYQKAQAILEGNKNLEVELEKQLDDAYQDYCLYSANIMKMINGV